ncbi:monooxygenase [Aspergillus sclerotialis]|uniref:Monooxygenase n=1 Tax=Aspergillus sclerotialis TaxID=2070753 RepID=A0A3A2ZP50_9EURO|nr:monooxygenase [Aspergillus sclerotialis]
MAAAAVESAIPSHMRPAPGSVNIHVAKFPPATKSASTIDPAAVASNLVRSFNQALYNNDFTALSHLFVDGGYWRDHLALTWAFRTVHTPSAILDFLWSASRSKDGFRLRKIAIDDTTDIKAPKLAPIDTSGQLSGVQFFITLETVIGAGTGLVSLVEQGGEWKIFTLYTRLEELCGHEEAVNKRRSQGVQHGGRPGRKNWAERRQEEAEFTSSNPAVLIAGAGQAGLTAAARLKMLGVKALIVDQNERVGDNWRKRYHQLVLHDPVWYDHMPYLRFPEHWPIFTPEDKLAEFFEAYVKLLELDVWMSTEIIHTQWDEAKKSWKVILNRKRADGNTNEIRTIHPRHIIQATGHSGKKNQPALKNAEKFQGDCLCHSSEFQGARENSEGKKAVVVGSCNSANDIAQDYLEKGYDVTMVQRSSTHVISSKAITDIVFRGVYDENSPPVDDADMLIHGLPTPVLKALHTGLTKKTTEYDRDMLDGLKRAGFKADLGPDDAGLLIKYFQRGGGYYIDVGACQLIAEGKIKVKQGQEISEVLPRGLRFADGTELEADEIILATGYQNMRTQTRVMFGDEVVDRVGDVWGFNEEGEMRTIWQRSGHPGFWFHGGNLAMCRYYSKPLALQIKALEVGLYQDGDI